MRHISLPCSIVPVDLSGYAGVPFLKCHVFDSRALAMLSVHAAHALNNSLSTNSQTSTAFVSMWFKGGCALGSARFSLAAAD
eukprot:3028672-Amphidinium_carterae.1